MKKPMRLLTLVISFLLIPVFPISAVAAECKCETVVYAYSTSESADGGAYYHLCIYYHVYKCVKCTKLHYQETGSDIHSLSSSDDGHIGLYHYYSRRCTVCSYVESGYQRCNGCISINSVPAICENSAADGCRGHELERG